MDIQSQQLAEILFYAQCQLQGMIAENQDRLDKGLAVAYTEEAFVRLAEETRSAFRRVANL